jgi:hypothetical protein
LELWLSKPDGKSHKGNHNTKIAGGWGRNISPWADGKRASGETAEFVRNMDTEHTDSSGVSSEALDAYSRVVTG